MLRGSVDVGVQQTHCALLLGQGQRQIGRHGGLADTTLARGDRDDSLDPRDHMGPSGRLGLGGGLHHRQLGLEPHLCLLDRVYGSELTLHLGAERP